MRNSTLAIKIFSAPLAIGLVVLEGCTRAARKPHLRARKVVCIPLLIPQPGIGKDTRFLVAYHI